MLRIVVVFLGFDSRIGEVIDFHRYPQLLPCALDHSCRGLRLKTVGELVEHAALTSSRRIQTRNFDATYGVADIEKSAGLASLPYTVSGRPIAAWTQKRLRTVPKISS